MTSQMNVSHGKAGHGSAYYSKIESGKSFYDPLTLSVFEVMVKQCGRTGHGSANESKALTGKSISSHYTLL